MKRIGLVLLLSGVAALADTPKSFTGVITDTMCGAKHTMLPGKSDAECVKLCIKGSSEYALYDGKTMWKLSGAKTAPALAAKKVKVLGVANDKTKTIKVTSIQTVE